MTYLFILLCVVTSLHASYVRVSHYANPSCSGNPFLTSMTALDYCDQGKKWTHCNSTVIEIEYFSNTTCGTSINTTTVTPGCDGEGTFIQCSALATIPYSLSEVAATLTFSQAPCKTSISKAVYQELNTCYISSNTTDLYFSCTNTTLSERTCEGNCGNDTNCLYQNRTLDRTCSKGNRVTLDYCGQSSGIKYSFGNTTVTTTGKATCYDIQCPPIECSHSYCTIGDEGTPVCVIQAASDGTSCTFVAGATCLGGECTKQANDATRRMVDMMIIVATVLFLTTLIL